jgi:hypothetical protein
MEHKCQRCGVQTSPENLYPNRVERAGPDGIGQDFLYCGKCTADLHSADSVPMRRAPVAAVWLDAFPVEGSVSP